jgi:hypothetical protein
MPRYYRSARLLSIRGDAPLKGDIRLAVVIRGDVIVPMDRKLSGHIPVSTIMRVAGVATHWIGVLCHLGSDDTPTKAAARSAGIFFFLSAEDPRLDLTLGVNGEGHHVVILDEPPTVVALPATMRAEVVYFSLR